MLGILLSKRKNKIVLLIVLGVCLVLFITGLVITVI